MSDSGLEALAAEAAVEAKLSEHGADTIRSPFGEAQDSAPEQETAEVLRDEQGRFTNSTDTELTGLSEAPDEAVEAEEVVSADPAVAAFLNKYGGDVDKALAGAVHLQRKAGEQSNELGDLRRMVDELSNLSQAIQSQNQPQQQQYVDQATVDWYDQQVIDSPAQALEWARQQQNPLLVQRGLSVWKDIDPYAAAVYTNRLENQAIQAQMQEQMRQQAQLPQQATVSLALQAVLNRNPQFTNYNDALEATMQKHPFAAEALKQASDSGVPQQIEGAIETLYSLAMGDTLQSLALTPAATGQESTTVDVVEPTVSETRDPAPEPSGTDRFREAFRQESERVRKGVWVAE